MNRPGSVVLVGYYPPPLGGESVHVRQLAQRLREAGVHVRVINARRGAPPHPDYRHVSGAIDFVTALRETVVDETVLHFHTNGHSGKSWRLALVVAAFLRARRAHGVLTLHSGMAPDYLERLGPVGRRIVKLAIASFAHVVCVNVAIRRAVEAIGVPASRLSILPAYLGVPEAGRLSGEDGALIEEFRPLVVAAGGADPEYGLPLLVEAIADLAAEFPALGCVIMGAGANARLERLVAARALSGRVRCLGEVQHDRYVSLLARADVFVRPSHVDGDAVSVREALAMRVPVVASDTDFRPAGVLLFRRGDRKHLSDTLRQALRSEARATSPARPSTANPVATLLRIYGAA